MECTGWLPFAHSQAFIIYPFLSECLRKGLSVEPLPAAPPLLHRSLLGHKAPLIFAIGKGPQWLRQVSAPGEDLKDAPSLSFLLFNQVAGSEQVYLISLPLSL